MKLSWRIKLLWSEAYIHVWIPPLRAIILKRLGRKCMHSFEGRNTRPYAVLGSRDLLSTPSKQLGYQSTPHVFFAFSTQIKSHARCSRFFHARRDETSG